MRPFASTLPALAVLLAAACAPDVADEAAGLTPHFFGEQAQKLLAADAQPGNQFGWSIAVSGDFALVGAYFDDTAGGVDAGSAYVFRRDGTGAWSQAAQLTASDGAASDWFGYSVALDGDFPWWAPDLMTPPVVSMRDRPTSTSARG